MNGEKFDFSKPVTSSLTLVAKYEEAAEEPTILEGKLASIEVSLDSEILLRQKFLLPEELINDDAAYAVVIAEKRGGTRETIIPMSELRAKGADSNGRYVIEQGMASGEMGRNMTVSFVDGNGNYVNLTDYADGSVVTATTRTVVDYAKVILEKGSKIQKDLVAAMLTYGGYAQVLFNVDAAAPVYNVLTEFGMEIPDVSGITADSIDQVMTSTGAALVTTSTQQAVVDSAIYQKIYIAPAEGTSLEELTYKITKCNRLGEYVEETDVRYEAEKDRYYIQIDDIASALLDYMYNVEITDAEGNVQNIRASVVCYLKRLLAVSTNVKQLNVFRSMCYYNQVANSYFGL